MVFLDDLGREWDSSWLKELGEDSRLNTEEEIINIDDKNNYTMKPRDFKYYDGGTEDN